MNCPNSLRASVCVPVRNGQKYLRACLDSILRQSLAEIEVIICDNASTDATESICRGYVARDRRVTYIRHETNIGPAANFNFGLGMARAPYFHWQASDDLIHPEFLERCIEALESDPSAVLVYPRASIVDDHLNEIERYDFMVDAEAASVSRRFRALVLARCRDHRNFEVFGVMRTGVARALRGHGAWAHGDRVFTVDMALRGKLVRIEPRLFLSRRHSRQSMQTLPTRVLPGAGQSILARWLGPGPLPPPEWWNPELANRICFPDWNLLGQYLRAIRSAPLTRGEQFRCGAALLEWAARYWMKLARDVIFAGETIVLRLVERLRSAVGRTADVPSPDAIQHVARESASITQEPGER